MAGSVPARDRVFAAGMEIVLFIAMPPFVSHHGCGGFEITLELADGEFGRDFIVGFVHQHALDEVVDEVYVGSVVNGVEPNESTQLIIA